MKILPPLLFSIIVLTTFTACSDGSSPASPQADTEVKPTGNRFFDAAANKIAALDEDVSPAQAVEIVNKMTEDGTIGLGEINGMNFQDPSQNAEKLNTAFESAKAMVLAD